jgi:molybdate transport system ATP-binding protein
MVFQEPGLFDHLTVRGNLEYGRKRAPAAGPAIDYDHVISMLALEHLLESRPRQLSLGEQQRVAIGRSLLNKPCVLLMDEPLASLDGRRKLEIIPFLRKLPRVFNVPVIYVSHSVPEIYQLADQLIVLDQGSVVAHGPVHETCTRLEFIRQLDDHVGVVLDASVADHEAEYGLTRLTVGRQQLLVPYRDLPPGEPLRVFIAATNISLALAPPSTAISVLNILEATVRRIDEQHDASHNVYVTLDVGAPLLARITRKSLHNLDLKPGQTVYAYIKAVSLEEHL